MTFDLNRIHEEYEIVELKLSYINNILLKQFEGIKINELVIADDDHSAYFIFDDEKRILELMHQQDCCEDVYLADIDVDDDFAGNNSYIVSFEEVGITECTGEYGDSETYTFYRIQSTTGSCWMRWVGTSNGYYSERVDFTIYKRKE